MISRERLCVAMNSEIVERNRTSGFASPRESVQEGLLDSMRPIRTILSPKRQAHICLQTAYWGLAEDVKGSSVLGCGKGGIMFP